DRQGHRQPVRGSPLGRTAGAATSALLLVGCVTETPHRAKPLAVKTSVESVPGADGTASGPLGLGLSTDPGAAVGQEPQGQERRAELEARLRAQFGSSVVIGPDGRVTKQYLLAGDLGPTFLRLITEIVPEHVPEAKSPTPPPPGTKVGGPQSHSILGRMLGGR